VAEASKVEIHGLEVAVDGTIEKQEGGFRFTRIILRPVVSIPREEDRERVGRLLEKAEKVCLVSRSILATMTLEPKVVVEAPVGV
jgi:organic hydroperoxide reductase OsmC/OhrA